jgi:hypothetical protein
MKISKTRLALFSAAGLTLLLASPDEAAAHICLDFPVSRAGAECVVRTPQKIGPCGINERSTQVTVFRPGATIEVVIRETINHPSHYRIAFDPNGQDFPDPVAVDDVNPDHRHVLLDGITDEEDAVQTVQVTLPDVECENCTLQLIQVMYDKQRNGFGGARGIEGDNDDLYYACADIALRREAASGTGDAIGTHRGRVATGMLSLAFAGLIGFSAKRRRDG